MGAKPEANYQFPIFQTLQYLDNKIYEDGKLKTILTEEGYIEKEGNAWKRYYYLRDHQGSTRVVLDESGNAVQSTDYYPFGAYLAKSTNQEKQPYKYNGKEFDHFAGLNLYDYGARFYDPLIGRFTTPDPLSEKYYSISPYAYCANNPVNAVDPDGRDIWEINENGIVVNRIEDKTQDAFFMIDSNRKRIEQQSISFEYGTINQTKVTVEHNTGDWSYDLYSINGSEDADLLFTFLADNTKVEFAHGVFGNEENKFNFITTTHKYTNEGGMRDVQLKQHMLDNPMLEHTHSHPKQYKEAGTFPSGLPGTDYYGRGDIRFAKDIQTIYGISPILKIYVPYTKETIYYNSNSVKSDYNHFK